MRSPRTPKRDIRDPLGPVEITDYLRRHPQFFQDHLDLLEILEVPHPSGVAVSLVARQIDLLREKNRNLQLQLDEILRVARDNDTLRQRLHQLTLAMLDATGLEDALGCLEWGLHQYFKTDFVAVRITSPVFESPIKGLLIPADSREWALLLPVFESGKPECGKPEPEQAGFLFGENAAEVESQALVPLQHAGLHGVLAIGSRKRGRFQAGMGLLFLSQLGEILSARLASLVSVLS